MMGYGFGWNGMGWGGWLGMGLFWLVVVGLLVWTVTRLLPADRGEQRGRGTDTSQDLLDRRFAAGEIDTDEYERRRAVLRQQAGIR